MLNNMTEGEPLKLILPFMVPLLIGNVFQQLYNIADVVIVGRTIGVEALAAVGAVTPLFMMTMVLTIGLSNGCTVVTGQRYGAGDMDGMRRSIGTCTVLSVLFTLFIMLFFHLIIDPADVGREYEPIIRINSQSGKGGTAFILANNYGIKMPKSMHPEFSAVVQKACDEKGKELKAEEVFDLFQQEYRNVCGPYRLVNYKISEEKNEQDDLTHVHFSGELKYKDNAPVQIEGNGNGPVAAFCDAMNQTEVASYQFVDYSEHAISVGSDSKAISYIHLKNPQGKDIFGIGVSHNIGYASMKGIICAINRDQPDTMRDDTMPGIFEVC